MSNINFDYNNLPPFKWFVLQNFPFIEADFDALTNWQLFCKLGKEMNKVIENVNLTGEQVENLTNAFISLETFVNNYFDNLDVQEEVNNKLDEMAEDGTLQEIITAYLQVNGILAFNSVADMKQATNLVNGSFTETYGFYSAGDGGSAKYKVRTITNNDTIDEKTIIALDDDSLVAELIVEDEMSIKQFGAKGDGTHDDTSNIQSAINYTNKIFVPETDNYYKVTDDIAITSNKIISGLGEKSKILMPDNLEKSIFLIENANNIIIDNLKLCNENYQTGENPDLAKNKIIYTNNVHDITIKNCFFENAYSRGIQIFKTKNLNYINNTFKNATYEMLFLLPETENVIVDNCIFDTITSSYINTYLFSTGRVDTDTYDFSCKNVVIKNSKFLNNPNWEGIDTHGCNGLLIDNNYIKNCKVGIMAFFGSTSPVTSDTIKNGNITITNNEMYCSESTNVARQGIKIGSSQAILADLCKNVNIQNNKIYNFGDAETRGGIDIEGVKNFSVLNNEINNSSGAGISLVACYNGKIKNNIIMESYNYGITCVQGVWFVDVVNNTIKNLEKSNLVRAIRSGTALCILTILDNDIQGANEWYGLAGTNMFGVINANTDQMGKLGSYVKNMYGLITHYCTDRVVRPAKTGSNTNVSLSATAGTKTVSGTNAMYHICPGEEVILPGAGTSGANLTTVVIDFINKDTFTVKDEIKTSITNVNPSFTAGSWTAV